GTAGGDADGVDGGRGLDVGAAVVTDAVIGVGVAVGCTVEVGAGETVGWSDGLAVAVGIGDVATRGLASVDGERSRAVCSVPQLTIKAAQRKSARAERCIEVVNGATGLALRRRGRKD